MTASHETVLSVIPGATPHDRLLVVLVRTDGRNAGAPRGAGQGSRVELRQQSWGEGVGWFTQAGIQVAPQQLAELRCALGGQADRRAASPRTTSETSDGNPPANQPRLRLVTADSA